MAQKYGLSIYQVLDKENVVYVVWFLLETWHSHTI